MEELGKFKVTYSRARSSVRRVVEIHAADRECASLIFTLHEPNARVFDLKEIKS